MNHRDIQVVNQHDRQTILSAFCSCITMIFGNILFYDKNPAVGTMIFLIGALTLYGIVLEKKVKP